MFKILLLNKNLKKFCMIDSFQAWFCWSPAIRRLLQQCNFSRRKNLDTLSFYFTANSSIKQYILVIFHWALLLCFTVTILVCLLKQVEDFLWQLYIAIKGHAPPPPKLCLKSEAILIGLCNHSELSLFYGPHVYRTFYLISVIFLNINSLKRWTFFFVFRYFSSLFCVPQHLLNLKKKFFLHLKQSNVHF